jgi:Rieske 2Fe-2S family protein
VPGRRWSCAPLGRWQVTSEQDWDLCERNHAGVRNPAFMPGPYSRHREYNVLAFVDWYLDRMRAG